MIWMGIDLGTTGCKSLVCTEQGQVLAEQYEEYELTHTPEGYLEQDAELWWCLVCRTAQETVRAIGPEQAGRVGGISVSSQGISFVPADRSGSAIGPAISWLDLRAGEQAEQLKRLFAEQDIFSRTGKRISPAYTLPKLMWLKQRQPDLYSRSARFLMPLDYITGKLTGQWCTDYAMASGTMAFNIRTGAWDQEILQACGIDSGKLPRVATVGSRVGPIDPQAAQALGLPPTVQVILGTQDQKCAALAAGIDLDVATVSLGTASAISTLARQPVLDPAMRIPCFALGHQRWILESVIGTACVSLKWLRNKVLPDLDYPQLDDLAATARPGSSGVFFYPHMEGAGSPFWQSDQRGALYGLSLATEKADLVRALLEGIAFQIKTNLQVQENITGTKIREIRIFGGGSKSEFWCALIANATGIPVSQCPAELANLGAALLAAQARADRPAGQEFLARAPQILKRFVPDRDQQQYEAVYQAYRVMEDRMLGRGPVST